MQLHLERWPFLSGPRGDPVVSGFFFGKKLHLSQPKKKPLGENGIFQSVPMGLWVKNRHDYIRLL